MAKRNKATLYAIVEVGGILGVDFINERAVINVLRSTKEKEKKCNPFINKVVLLSLVSVNPEKNLNGIYLI